jgi:hypothetical protein
MIFKFTQILAMLTVLTIIGMVTTSVEQAYAPRNCGGCIAFKKLTHEFEKDVIEAATTGDLGLIPSLLEQYNQDVKELDLAR